MGTEAFVVADLLREIGQRIALQGGNPYGDDHTAPSFLGFVLLGCIRIWIRFVHAT
jgi:hypothetical protein